VLGGLTGPLINRKAIQANFQTADAQQLEALYEYDKTLLTAYSEVCTLMSKIEEPRAILPAQDRRKRRHSTSQSMWPANST
jgi:outer membrane protein TolC